MMAQRFLAHPDFQPNLETWFVICVLKVFMTLFFLSKVQSLSLNLPMEPKVQIYPGCAWMSAILDIDWFCYLSLCYEILFWLKCHKLETLCWLLKYFPTVTLRRHDANFWYGLNFNQLESLQIILINIYLSSVWRMEERFCENTTEKNIKQWKTVTCNT